MKIPHAFLLLASLASCSSAPRFRKSDGLSDGYQVRELAGKDVLEIRAPLPPGLDVDRRLSYLGRAVGEECAARGFPYFDSGMVSGTAAMGFCYPDASRVSVGVDLDAQAALAASPSLAVLEPAGGGVPAPFHPGDIVRKVGGQEIATIGAFKEAVHRLAREKRRSVTVLAERSGIPLTLEAPLREWRDLPGTPETLRVLRMKAP